MFRKLSCTPSDGLAPHRSGINFVFVLMALAWGATSHAQPSQTSTPEWSWQVTPYVWATGVGGSIRAFPGAPEVSVKKSFSDLLKDLDGAFFLTGLARRDQLIIAGDISASSSSKSGLAPQGIPAEARLRQRSLTLSAGYRAVENNDVTLDLLAGVRAWSVRASVAAPALGLRAQRTADFADPILAARLNLRIDPNWTLLTYADFGGFGVGSRFTGQVVATANYQWREDIYFSAGYRRLHVDYRKGGSRIDLHAGGPLLGATFRF